jgi:hypothetical protein
MLNVRVKESDDESELERRLSLHLYSDLKSVSTHPRIYFQCMIFNHRLSIPSF